MGSNGIKSRLPFKIFSTLAKFSYKVWIFWESHNIRIKSPFFKIMYLVTSKQLEKNVALSEYLNFRNIDEIYEAEKLHSAA